MKEEGDESSEQVSWVPDAPTKIKGAEVLREYLTQSEKSQKFFSFARRRTA